jgi:hypothetical protein
MHKAAGGTFRFHCCESCVNLDTEAFWERFIHRFIDRLLKYREEGYYLG